MSGTKIWTRQLRESARAARLERAADEQGRRARKKQIVRGAVVSAGAFVAVGALELFAVHSTDPAVVVTAALSSLATVAAGWLYRWLRPRLGTLTAVLALSVICAVLFLAVAAAAPHCPDSAAPGRCTVPELANWTLVGALMPMPVALLVGVPVSAWRAGVKTVKFLVRVWRSGSDPSPGTPRRGLLEWFRPSPRDRRR